MRGNLLVIAIVGLALFAAGEAVAATLTVFTDLNDFLDAAPGPVVFEDFNSIGSDIDTLPATPIDVGPFTVSSSGPSAGNIGVDFPSGDATSPGGFDRNVDGTTYLYGDVNEGQTLTLEFEKALQGIGFEGESTQNGPVNLNIAGEAVTVSDDGFFAVISDEPFESLDINGGDGAFGLDNFSLAQTEVPEPASVAIWSLLGLAAAGFAYRRWRNRR